VSLSVTLAVARRVLGQLRHDPRTLALALVVPCMLELILQQLFGRNSPVFQQVGTPLLGLFPFVTMFLVTSITMLRERTSGTLERLMTMPLHKVDLLAGYGIAFALLAVVQATLVSVLAFGFLGLEVDGPKWLVVGLAVANAVLGSTLGLFVSAFAQTEFQAVQFMPAVLLPQILLSGLFVPHDQMPRALVPIRTEHVLITVARTRCQSSSGVSTIPATEPTSVPRPTAINIAANPTESEIRPPYIERASRSRPRSSVPNGWAADGGDNSALKSSASGLTL